MIETDLWLQYQELAGTQDNEVSTIASQQIPGYPSQPSGGNSPYTNAVLQLDGDMDQYIHDNTEDELTHETSWAHTLHQWGFSLLYLQKFSNFLLPSRNISPAVSV